MNYIKVYEDLDVISGTDNWDLIDMEWYPEDGMTCFQYERIIEGEGIELAIVWRPQPITFRHTGWWERDRTERVLELTALDRSRYERGLYNDPVEGYDL
jgi:hypothetical protein